MGIFSNSFARPFATVSALRSREMLDDGALLVDVRTNTEWNAGHAPIARHLPPEPLDGRLATGAGVVRTSTSGVRSAQAAGMLAAQRPRVAGVTGGMFAGQRPGGPVVTKNGREGTVA